MTTMPADDVPLWRLHLLRATYLLMVVGLGIVHVPNVFVHPPQAVGVVTSMLAGLWVLAWLGLRHPLKLLPLLAFEFVWKAIWVLVYGLPQWRAGLLTADGMETMQATLMGVVLVPIVMPWGYFFRTYITGAGERWRNRPIGAN